MDHLPPPPPVLQAPASPSYGYGPGDIYPRTGPYAKEEADLCDTASSPDWAYLGGLLALDIGAFYVENGMHQLTRPPWERIAGAGVIGITWGATLGGGWLALPKCDSHWVRYAPREGEVRAEWPLTLAIAVVAGISAPVLAAIPSWPPPPDWQTDERIAHVFVAAGAGVVGSLIPYLLPPKTYRAARELRRLRAGGDPHGAFVTYSFTF